VHQRLDSVEVAYEDQMVWVVGKEQLRIRRGNAKTLGRKMALATFLCLRGTGSKVANLNNLSSLASSTSYERTGA